MSVDIYLNSDDKTKKWEAHVGGVWRPVTIFARYPEYKGKKVAVSCDGSQYTIPIENLREVKPKGNKAFEKLISNLKKKGWMQ